MLLSIFPLSVFASNSNTELSYQDLSKTSIEYDFQFVYGRQMSVEDYPKNKTDEKLYFISAMESEDVEGNKELYFYVYNPSMKVIVKNTEFDKLSLAFYTSENDTTQNEYLKRNISLITTYGYTAETPDYTNALILKYRVDIKNNLSEDIDRFYRLADFEIMFPNESNATYFIAGKEFKFFTDKSGFVNCSFEDLTTIEMDAFHTFYRVDTEGVDKYTDIQSIYFPVSNELLKLYGSIYSMNVEWYTYLTQNALVVDDVDIRDAFYSKWVNIPSFNFEYSVLYNQYFPYNDFIYDYYRYSANAEALEDYIYWDTERLLNPNDYYVGYKWSDSPNLQLIPDTIGAPNDEISSPIKFVFYSDDVTTFLKTSVWGEEILAYIEAHNWNDDLFSPIGRNHYHNETFNVEMTSDKLYTYELCNAWEKFWNNDYYEVLTGEKIVFKHFQQIDLNDLNTKSVDDFSKQYLIDKYDVNCGKVNCNSCFSCRVNSEKYKDCTWFILRYDTTSFRSYDSNVINNDTGIEKVCNSNVFNTEVIRNFDTISVSFKDVDENGVETITVFPIGRSPTNFVADAWNPKEKPHIKIDTELADFLNKLEKILKIILFVLFSIIIYKIVKFIRSIYKRKKRKENE